jgi:hypothetical protein
MQSQYLFVNFAPGVRWNQNRPETITDALFREVPMALNATEQTAGTRRLGLSFILSYLGGPPDLIAETLRRLLAAPCASTYRAHRAGRAELVGPPTRPVELVGQDAGWLQRAKPRKCGMDRSQPRSRR